DVVGPIELWHLEQLLPADAVAAAPERATRPARRRDVVARFVRGAHHVTAGGHCVRGVAGGWKLLIVGLGSVEGDPRDLRRVWGGAVEADVLATEEGAVGQHDAVDDVSGLLVADDHRPARPSVGGAEEAGLVVEVAEEG